MTASQFYKYVAERGGVPQSYARQWTELIFTCLREVILREDYFRLGKICDFMHTVRKSGVTRNPVTGEYYMAADRDKIVVKMLTCVRRDFRAGIIDGSIESKVGGYVPPRPLTREECEERGYKVGMFKSAPARMRAFGYDMNGERVQSFFNGQFALAREQKAAAEAKKAEEARKSEYSDKENKE